MVRFLIWAMKELFSFVYKVKRKWQDLEQQNVECETELHFLNRSIVISSYCESTTSGASSGNGIKRDLEAIRNNQPHT